MSTKAKRQRDVALMRRKTEIDESLRLLTKLQVADIFGVSWRTVNRWVAMGKLKALKFGNVLRFEPAEVQRFLSASERR